MPRVVVISFVPDRQFIATETDGEAWDLLTSLSEKELATAIAYLSGDTEESGVAAIKRLSEVFGDD